MTRPEPYGMPDSSAYPIAAGVPDSGVGDDQVGVGRVLAGQPAADLDPGGVHRWPEIGVSGRAR